MIGISWFFGFSIKPKERARLLTKYGFHSVVVHITGVYSKVGVQSLERVLDFCQKKNINLAIENLDNQELFLKVMENVKHPNLSIRRSNCFL